MKAYVYTDKSLERYAGRFVWLSINTEQAKNAAFLEKYPIPALPTLLVLDAKTEKVTLRYVGGATVTQLRKLLDDSLKSGRTDADTLLSEADRLASAGKTAEAAAKYEAAIKAAPTKWARFGRASESLLFALSGEPERCSAMAMQLYPRVKGTVSGANVAAIGLGCATGLKDATVVTTLEQATRAALDDPKVDISADDRSGLYIALIGAREYAKDDAGTKALKEEWVRFLEASATSAKSAEQRAVYDSHRLSAYLDLGTPEKALPMLEQSERDFPDDYNPPARLAAALRALKRYDEALAASDRAMARVYGPRKLTVMSTRADIYADKGDKAGARKTLTEAIAYAKALPPHQRSERRTAQLQKKLEGLAE
ncbi:MAG TPA: tetratricopeptide repeat protein [Thermoanaerobaculia bacterium]